MSTCDKGRAGGRGAVATSSVRRFAKTIAVPLGKRLTARVEIARYLKTPGEKRLNLGCGANIVEGWLNVDLTPRPRATFLDGRGRWALPDAAFDLVLCEHMIEHIDQAAGVHLLAESHRVLKPGGVIRVATPDLDRLGRLLTGPRDAADEAHRAAVAALFGRGSMTWGELVNSAFYEHGHRRLYTVEELQAAILAAGFQAPVLSRAGEPTDRRFAGVEGHARVAGAAINATDAYAIEAVKPG